MLRRGAFIVLEGCDRVGKTTHAKMLAEALKEDGQKVEMMQFPDRSSLIGDVINKYLQGSEELEDHAIHLLFSANRWEQVPKIVKLLNSGVNLIVDRYAYSGVAFSYAKKGLNFSWCKQSDVGLPKPDLVLFLDLPNATTNAERAGFGEERYENVEFQTEVKKIYGLLQEDNWKIVNTDRPKEEVHQDLKVFVQEAIDNVSSPACETLWTDNYETYV